MSNEGPARILYDEAGNRVGVSTNPFQVTGSVRVDSVGVTGPVRVDRVGVTGPVGVTGQVAVVGPVGVTGPVRVDSVGGTGPFRVDSVGVTGPVRVDRVGITGFVQVTGPMGVTGQVAIIGPVGVTGPVRVDSVGVTGPVRVDRVGITGFVQATGPIGVTGLVQVVGPVGVTGPVRVDQVGMTGPVRVDRVGVTGPVGVTGIVGVSGPVTLYDPSGAPLYGQRVMTMSVPVVVASDQVLNVSESGSSGTSATFYAVFDRIAPAQDKYMATLFNTSATKKIVIFRINRYNWQASAVNGQTLDQYLARITARTAGTNVDIRAADTVDVLPAGISADTGSTAVSEDHVIRRLFASSEESNLSNSNFYNALTLDYSVSIYERTAGTRGIVLRQNEGIAIRNITNSSVGSVSYLFDFVVEDV